MTLPTGDPELTKARLLAERARRQANEAHAAWRRLDAYANDLWNRYHTVARARGYCSLCEKQVADCECVVMAEGENRISITIYQSPGWEHRTIGLADEGRGFVDNDYGPVVPDPGLADPGSSIVWARGSWGHQHVKRRRLP